MDLNLRINIDLAKSTNYIPMGFWVKPVAGDPKKPFYRITDLGIPMVKVEDGSALGYSVYVLNVDVSDDVVPSASNPQWRLIESAELIYIQQAFIERLWTQMLIAEGAEIGGFEIKDGLLQSIKKDNNNNPLIVLNGQTGKVISNDSEVRGTVYAVDGEFNGKLKSVTGSFKWLYAVDDAGNIQGTITFRDGGQIEFDSDIYSQGYNDKKARSHRYYASDIWCRGTFGAAQRNTLVVYGTYGRYYTKGLDNPYYVMKSFTPKVDSNNNTYYIIPLYGGIPIGDYGDASGFAVDLVIFLSSTSYRYLLNGAPGKKVTLINGYDTISNPHLIYSMGNEVKLHGGVVREFYNIGGFHYPVLDTSILGQGWIAGEQCDNNWH